MEEQKFRKWEAIKTWKQWEVYIKNLLQNSDAAVESAIIKLYNMQEPDEKACRQSKHLNGIGFNKIDAYRLSGFAFDLKHNEHLTETQMSIARPIMMKYWKQLAKLSKANIKKLRESRGSEHSSNEQLQLDLEANMCRTQSDYVNFGSIKHDNNCVREKYSYQDAVGKVIKLSKTLTQLSYEMFKDEYEDGSDALVFEKLSESILDMADLLGLLGIEEVQPILRTFLKRKSGEEVKKASNLNVLH